MATLINVDSVNVDRRNLRVDTVQMSALEQPQSPELLTAAEAAARLGVKRQTLYAYVSRGVLSRRLSLDGRTSLYAAADIDALRTARRRPTSGEVTTVIASSISRVLDSGHEYRGVAATSLIDQPFEQVANHLWNDVEPWTIPDSWIEQVSAAQRLLPHDTPFLDRARMAVNVTASLDRLRDDPAPANHCQAGRRMLLATVRGLPTNGERHAELDQTSTLADQLWTKVTPEVGTAQQRAALNAGLVLLADHGIAASTFAARVAASVRADPYSIVSAGLGALAGPLHGGASRLVHQLLTEAHAEGCERVLGRRLAGNQRIPGVGHAVYKRHDSREAALHDLIALGWTDDHRLEIYETLRQLLAERVNAPLNVDFALGALTWLAGMGPAGGQSIFIARIAGWIAHGIEEFSEDPLRFRPVARWIPERPELPEDA